MQNYDRKNKCLVKSQYTTTIVGVKPFLKSHCFISINVFSRDFDSFYYFQDCNLVIKFYTFLIYKEFHPVVSSLFVFVDKKYYIPDWYFNEDIFTYLIFSLNFLQVYQFQSGKIILQNIWVGTINPFMLKKNQVMTVL